MNKVKFVQIAPGAGELYVNDVKLQGVLSIEPELFERDQIAQVTVVLAVESFEFVPQSE